MRLTLYILAAATCLCSQAALAQSTSDNQADKSDPATWRLSTGVNYSTGDYGDTRDTEVISVPVGLKYSKGPLSIRVSVPYVRIKGPGSLIDTPQGRDASGGRSDDSRSGSNSGSGSSSGGSGSGSGGSGHGGSGSGGSGSGSSGSSGGSVDDNLTAPSSTRSGLGDVSVAMTYSFDFGNSFYADVTGRVKVPTASRAKRLGTGQVDFTAGVDLIKDLGKASLYVGGRRKFIASTATQPLRDIWGFGGGASYQASKAVTLGADYDWQQSSSVGSGPSSEVTGWANFRLNDKMRLQVFGSTGFTTNSADFSGGMTLSFRL